MVQLSSDDFQKLVNLLKNHNEWGTPFDRRNFVRMTLEGTDRAQVILGQLRLDGSPMGAATETITTLARFGQVAYGKEALGVFLNFVKEQVGLEEAKYIEDLFHRYPLDKPVVTPPPLEPWKGSYSAAQVQEKIFGENTLQHVNFLQLAFEAAKAVVHITLPDGMASGFMLTPNVLVTNHHVLHTPQEVEQAVFTFNYQLGLDGKESPTIKAYGQPDGLFLTDQQLDFTLVQLRDVPDFGKPLKPNTQLVKRDERVTIIQHPGGHFKKISTRDNLVEYADRTVLQYNTATLPGSSGSPIFNDKLELVGIHHSGGPMLDPGTGMRVYRNAGTSIIALLQAIDRYAPDLYRTIMA